MILALALIAAAGGTIPGLDALLRPSTVLLLGEIHGTAESPGFVGEVARQALDKDLDVVVAVELPQDEQSRIDALLASKGAPEDLARFLEGDFWRRDYQDGRTSEAMLSLLLDLRTLKAAGKTVRVVALDVPSAGKGRDAAMAARLGAVMEESPGSFIVSLTGNLHNRITAGSGRMGALVSKDPGSYRIVSLNVSHAGGTTWNCSPTECGERTLKGGSTETGRRVTMPEAPDGRGYHGTYHVGTITASPPARDVRESPPRSDRRP